MSEVIRIPLAEKLTLPAGSYTIESISDSEIVLRRIEPDRLNRRPVDPALFVGPWRELAAE